MGVCLRLKAISWRTLGFGLIANWNQRRKSIPSSLGSMMYLLILLPRISQSLGICAQSLQSCLSAALWIVAHQAPLSLGFSRKEYLNALPCPSSGNLLNPGIEPSCVSCIADRFFIHWVTWEALSQSSPGTKSSFQPMSFMMTLLSVCSVFMKESESEVTQSCLTLCDPMDCSPPGSSIYGIF